VRIKSEETGRRVCASNRVGKSFSSDRITKASDKNLQKDATLAAYASFHHHKAEKMSVVEFIFDFLIRSPSLKHPKETSLISPLRLRKSDFQINSLVFVPAPKTAKHQARL
jgi:hypothetical protein